jgi:hypothetical protein
MFAMTYVNFPGPVSRLCPGDGPGDCDHLPRPDGGGGRPVLSGLVAPCGLAREGVRSAAMPDRHRAEKVPERSNGALSKFARRRPTRPL